MVSFSSNNFGMPKFGMPTNAPHTKAPQFGMARIFHRSEAERDAVHQIMRTSAGVTELAEQLQERQLELAELEKRRDVLQGRSASLKDDRAAASTAQDQLLDSVVALAGYLNARAQRAEVEDLPEEVLQALAGTDPKKRKQELVDAAKKLEERIAATDRELTAVRAQIRKTTDRIHTGTERLTEAANPVSFPVFADDEPVVTTTGGKKWDFSWLTGKDDEAAAAEPEERRPAYWVTVTERDADLSRQIDTTHSDKTRAAHVIHKDDPVALDEALSQIDEEQNRDRRRVFPLIG